jgi:hypothetical protein
MLRLIRCWKPNPDHRGWSESGLVGEQEGAPGPKRVLVGTSVAQGILILCKLGLISRNLFALMEITCTYGNKLLFHGN